MREGRRYALGGGRDDDPRASYKTEAVVVSVFAAAVVGGLIGGVLGVAGTLVTSYYGPRRLEEWRERKKDEREDGPRRRLLKQMLDDERFPDGRYLDTLGVVSGTSPAECRTLLIQIGARGVTLSPRDGSTEGWALISRKPLDQQ